MPETIDDRLAAETYEEAFYRHTPVLGDLEIESRDIDHNAFDGLAGMMHATHPFSRPVINTIINQVNEGSLTPKLGALELLFIEAED